MVWRKEYNTGIQEIDRQHQELVKIVSRLQGSLSTDAKYAEIGPTLKFLVNYTREHFESEEGIMEKIAYPDLAVHRRHHQNLIRQIDVVLHKLKNRESFTPIELYYLVSRWLMEHILNEDIKISRYYYDKVGKKMPSYLGSVEYTVEETCPEEEDCPKPLIAETIEQLYASRGKDQSDAGALCHEKIRAYYQSNPAQSLSQLKDVFESLDSLKKGETVDPGSIPGFKTSIYRSLDLRASLDQSASIDERLHFIKYLFEQQLFDDREYQRLKSEEVRLF